MKIKIKHNPVREIIKKLDEVTPGEVGLDPKKDTTPEDDDLLGLIPKDVIDDNSDYRYMLKAGYIPVYKWHDKEFRDEDGNIVKGFNSATLGVGAYGAVYDATKAGTNRRFAVKVTEDKNEVAVRKKLEDLRKTLPESVTAHIARVYEIQKIEQGTAGNKQDKYIIAMQLLRPMNSFEETVLYKGVTALNKFIDNFNLPNYLKDWNIFNEVVRLRLEKKTDFVGDFEHEYRTVTGKKMGSHLEPILGSLNTHLTDGLLETINRDDFKNLWIKEISAKIDDLQKGDIDKKTIANFYYEAYSKVAGDFFNQVWSALSKNKRFITKMNQHRIDLKLNSESFDKILNYTFRTDDLANGIRWEIKDYINNLDKKSGSSDYQMKHSYTEFIEKYKFYNVDNKQKMVEKISQILENMPEKVQKLMRALLKLAIGYGVLWQDLHHGNIMINPETREYIATDVGLFKLS